MSLSILRRNSAGIRVACFVVIIIFIFLTWREARTNDRVNIGQFGWSAVDASKDSLEQYKVSDDRALNKTLLSQTPPYISAIFNATDQTFPRLQCPKLDAKRYNKLRGDVRSPTTQPQYFFALDLHQSAHLIPRLIGSIIEAARFLGFSNCALSIVEGRSDDGTYEILHSLQNDIAQRGLRYFFESSDINPLQGDRVESLALLRNLALKPFNDAPYTFADDATVIFLNDVSLCTEDILELVYQRKLQQADMTCAMDWTYVGPDPTFYDIWIARGLTGETFFEVPADGNWNSAWNLFWNDVKAAAALRERLPFQVFSCWNGAVTFRTDILKKIWFRRNYNGECYAGEPRLFNKDMWYYGFGKIAVVPSVNVEYSDEGSKRIKELKGFASQYATEKTDQLIEWQANPPETVKCVSGWDNQTMLPWDENLAENGIYPR